MTRRRLPIGIQTFREVREDGCYYVDKTPFIEQLLDGGKHYFLSRPRRFGKSLFLDTLKELFEGSEALFEGLAIHDRWDWSVRYPVVRLDFGGGSFREPGALHANLMEQLDTIERGTTVERRYDTAPERFRHLIRTPCTARPGSGWWCWWTSTTSPSWRRSATLGLPRGTAISCAACSGTSRPATRTFGSPF